MDKYTDLKTEKDKKKFMEIMERMKTQPIEAMPVEEGGTCEPISDRAYCLEKARQIVCDDRDKQYGKPENSFPVIAKLWSAYLGVDITPQDSAIMLGLLKVARIKTGKYKEDNYIDLAGYTACAYELGGQND